MPKILKNRYMQLMFPILLYSFLDKRHGSSFERKIPMYSRMLCANFDKTSCSGSGESIISIAFGENVAFHLKKVSPMRKDSLSHVLFVVEKIINIYYTTIRGIAGYQC